MSKEITVNFAKTVFTADAEANPVFVEAHRTVRAAAGKAARTINFKSPVLKATSLAFVIALAEAKSQVPTEHKVKTTNPDGTETENVVKSTLLDDEVNEFIADRAEDATEVYLTKGDLFGYFNSFIHGVSKDRESEKTVTEKLTKLRADIGALFMALQEGEAWTAEIAEQLGVPDKEAAIAKRDNLIVQTVSLRAKLETIKQAKAAREVKKDKKA
jgi:hypothetical protein